MALQILQVPKDKPFFSQRHTLDGQDYLLTFEWNSRSGWYLGLSQGSTVLFYPRKLVVDQDLLQHCRANALCPPGNLFAYDMSGLGRDPGFEDLVSGSSASDLQGRVILSYAPVA
jgi:hypothetical protein